MAAMLLQMHMRESGRCIMSLLFKRLQPNTVIEAPAPLHRWPSRRLLLAPPMLPLPNHSRVPKLGCSYSGRCSTTHLDELGDVMSTNKFWSTLKGLRKKMSLPLLVTGAHCSG